MWVVTMLTSCYVKILLNRSWMSLLSILIISYCITFAYIRLSTGCPKVFMSQAFSVCEIFISYIKGTRFKTGPFHTVIIKIAAPVVPSDQLSCIQTNSKASRPESPGSQEFSVCQQHCDAQYRPTTVVKSQQNTSKWMMINLLI